MKYILLSSVLLLAACTKPSLPDPRVDYAVPPVILMEPAREPQPINGD